MPDDEPPILSYQNPGAAGTGADRFAVAKYFAGVGIAFFVGLIVCLIAVTLPGYDGLVVILIGTPIVMVVVGLALLPARRSRMMGAGALTVGALAGLVLLILCAH